MADLKAAIREMLSRGMTEAQVKENLSQMGIADVDLMFDQATQSLHSMDIVPPQTQEQPIQQESEIEIQRSIDEPEKQIITQSLDEKSMETLEDVKALLKSVEELNKKIL